MNINYTFIKNVVINALTLTVFAFVQLLIFTLVEETIGSGMYVVMFLWSLISVPIIWKLFLPKPK